jgi:hypothetical protein
MEGLNAVVSVCLSSSAMEGMNFDECHDGVDNDCDGIVDTDELACQVGMHACMQSCTGTCDVLSGDAFVAACMFGGKNSSPACMLRCELNKYCHAAAGAQAGHSA